jgi:ABC-type transport system substrate-binding protein
MTALGAGMLTVHRSNSWSPELRPQQSTAGPKHGDTLRVAIGIDPETLDPAAQITTTARQIVDMMAETLTTINEKGQLQPLLATGWDRSSDGLTWTFTLRQNVKFSDGTPFDAAAVKFSFDRLLSPNTFRVQPGVLGGKAGIDHVDVVDDSHVKFTLKAPLAPFAAAVSQTDAAIVSPASVSVVPNSPAVIARPVGTGPYKFVERAAGDHITLAANKDYWGRKPSYDTQIYKIVPEAASREALVKSGGVDIMALPPANDLPALRADSSLRVVMGPSDRTITIVINTVDTAQPLLRKPEVRQALNYAIDKNAIIKNVMFGAATPLNAPMAETLFGYCPVGSYGYDPAKAKRLLEANGAAGISVKLVSPTGRYVQDIQVAHAVAGYLRDVGLKVDGPGTTQDWPTYVATYVDVPPSAASTDLHLLGWAPSYLDAQEQFEQFYSPRTPPGGVESSYYKNAQVDALVARANAETDPSERQADYCSAAKQVWNDAPWIFLYNQKSPIVTTTKVTGVVGLPNEKFVTAWASPR